MAELQDPVALSVTSTLKRLRTRTGLREERLYGTEVMLDLLPGLDSVRALVAAGETEKGAVVRAVRAAAARLEPTLSIVADASLGLELFADRVTDPDLYGQDLGQRREALLRNWNRLHELRSVSAGKAPSPRALRLEVESEALAALAVALTTTASTGQRNKPPIEVGEPRTSEPLPGNDPVGATAPTLLETFQDVAEALRASLVRDKAGTPVGWRHDLRDLSDLPDKATRDKKDMVTAVSTAYGIRTMLLLEDRLAPDLIPLAESLKAMAEPGGGYASRDQKEPRAESTAAVLNALRRMAPTEDFGDLLDQMDKNLGDFEKSRPFILTTMLETSLLFGDRAGLAGKLVDCLLKARREYDDGWLWPQKNEAGPVSPKPSVAHTARAVRVLADVEALRRRGLLDGVVGQSVSDAVEQGVSWLKMQRDLSTSYEIIDRPSEEVHTSHFMDAWVVKAFVSAGVPAGDPAVGNAVAGVWSRHGGATALWARDNGDLPIWMTFDAIEALDLASRAVPAPARLVPIAVKQARRDGADRAD